MDLPIPTVTKAQLQALPDGDPIVVHFNPASLVYSLENSTAQQGGDPKRRQYAGQFTGKLTMDLQFDTTDTGEDVRTITNQVALFMQSSAQASKSGGASSSNGANPPAQPVLAFQWGTYVFKGIMESFKETIDFFSADGVPLRALVSIGLARQDNVFDEDQSLQGTGTGAIFNVLSPASTSGPVTPRWTASWSCWSKKGCPWPVSLRLPTPPWSPASRTPGSSPCPPSPPPGMPRRWWPWVSMP